MNNSAVVNFLFMEQDELSIDKTVKSSSRLRYRLSKCLKSLSNSALRVTLAKVVIDIFPYVIVWTVKSIDSKDNEN